MDKWKKLFQEFSLKSDMINLALGMVLIVSLVLIFLLPNNPYVVLAACVSGGLINIMSGMKYMKEPAKKATGITFMMMGMIVIIIGLIIARMLTVA